MSSEITFLFPTNYRHGDLGKNYYYEKINILSVSPLSSDVLNQIFRKTLLFKKLKILSYIPYIEWISIYNTIYVAYAKIEIFYKTHKLKYFKVPTYEEVKYDFYLLTGEKNTINNTKEKVIKDKILRGKYIVSL